MRQPARIAVAGTLIIGRLAALFIIAGVEAVHWFWMWRDSRG